VTHTKRFLLGTVALLASLSLAEAQIATNIPLSANGAPFAAIPSDTISAAPVSAAFTVTGLITVTTVGSYTTGVLTVVPQNGVVTPQLPLGALITGSGVTTGTAISSVLNSTNYGVITTGGTIGAVSSETLTVTPKVSNGIVSTKTNTAPTYASGGCTAGSPAFATGSTVWSWSFTNGSGTCTGGNTVTFTFPAAATAWMCTAVDSTNPTTDIYVSTGTASATAVVFTDYSSAGAAQNTKANDVIVGSCTPR